MSDIIINRYNHVFGSERAVIKQCFDEVFSCFGYNFDDYAYTFSMPHTAVYLAQHGDKLVGFYILCKRSFNRVHSPWEGDINMELFERIENMQGVQGVALGVIPEYRGFGIGNSLKKLPKETGVEYIWGGQDKKLDNIDHWLKRRKLLMTTPDTWFTVEIFNS